MGSDGCFIGIQLILELTQAQWKECEQGTVINPVTALSILSKQTAQVGNSWVSLSKGSVRDRLGRSDSRVMGNGGVGIGSESSVTEGAKEAVLVVVET